MLFGRKKAAEKHLQAVERLLFCKEGDGNLERYLKSKGKGLDNNDKSKSIRTNN